MSAKKIEIPGIVRHYRAYSVGIAKEFYEWHCPYRGILHKPTDLESYEHNPISDALASLPDGEEVLITIQPLGQSQCAKGFIWSLTKPGIYERVFEKDAKPMEE